MTSRASTKRSNPSNEEGSHSDSASTSTRGDEKTIPFLRRLTDMLIENEKCISFSPGSRDNGQVVLGKIVVHDRVKVESSILPRYFNHSSFASLRRQLNYFSFTRIGKGRQRGATYCNEGVVVLEDILSLSRRSVTNNTSSGDASKAAQRRPSLTKQQLLQSHEETVPPKNPKRLRTMASNTSMVVQTPCASTNPLPARVSPVEGLVRGDKPAPKRISLDLTAMSSPRVKRASVTILPSRTSIVNKESPVPMNPALVLGDDEKDILAGCKALLCFSRSIPSR